MRIVLLLGGALAFFPTLTLAGPRDTGRAHNHRVHFATGIRWAHSAYRGYYWFKGVNWVVAPLAFPYGGLGVNSDFVYQGREVSDDVYPYAIPTSNPDIVISPFALNNLVDVSGIPPGARVRDPEESCIQSALYASISRNNPLQMPFWQFFCEKLP